VLKGKRELVGFPFNFSIKLNEVTGTREELQEEIRRLLPNTVMKTKKRVFFL
jgi:hypothetical protein